MEPPGAPFRWGPVQNAPVAPPPPPPPPLVGGPVCMAPLKLIGKIFGKLNNLSIGQVKFDGSCCLQWPVLIIH